MSPGGGGLALALVLGLAAAAPAHATDGAWTFIPPQTSPDSLPGPRIGGGMAWDADRDRMILAGGTDAVLPGGRAAPVVLLSGDLQWQRPTILGPAAPSTLGPWAIDRSRNRLVSLAGLGAIWSLDLVTFESRIDSIAGPQPIWDVFPVAVAMDSVRDQLLAFSVDVIRPGVGQRATLWTVPLHGTPSWTKRLTVYGTPPVEDDMAPIRFVYDTRRDQFLFSNRVDNAVLVMDPTPAWLPDPGLYGVPYGGAACYDTTRDLLVVFGGAGAAIGAEGTLAWSRTEAPTHRYLSTDYGGSPAASDPVMAFDGTRHRMVEAEGHDLLAPLDGAWAYTPPTAPRVILDCSAPAGAFPGTMVTFDYSVANGSSGALPIDYDVRCDRAWPPFPDSTSDLFTAGQVVGGVRRFVVPDTAASGPVTFRVSACCNAGLDPISICARTLLIVARPAPPTIASAVVLADTAVALRWSTAAGAAVSTTLLRSVNGSPPDTLARIGPDADGTVRYVDHDVTLGETLRYQLGIDTPAGPIWSDPVSLSVSGGAPTAFALSLGGATLVARGALDVSFTVPRAGLATLAAYDVRGRLVATARVDSPGAGIQSVRLAPAGQVRTGLYLLRLMQGDATARGRALVLPGP